MATQANAQGVLQGQFTIPAGVPAGAKSVEFVGQGGSRGTATFVGQGTLVSEVRQNVTTILETRWTPPRVVNVDPLAQTFSLPESTPIAGVNLRFTAKGTSDVIVQIRGATTGIPNNMIFAEGRVSPAAITLSGWTSIDFDAPTWLDANSEYAIVVMCNDAVTAVAVAELGKWDATANGGSGAWVSRQPHMGVLLSSSNASTWTPHQDRDLTFQLLKAVFSETEKVVNLGNAPVTDATDLMLLGLALKPTFQSRVEYTLALPGGQSVSVAEGQPVRLSAPVTGNVGITAKLSGTAAASPVLHPGTQLVAGEVETTADYVSVAFPAGSNSRIRVIVDAELPSGSALNVFVSGIDGGDTWQAVPFLSSVQLTANKHEVTYEKTAVNEAFVKIKLELTGTASARPVIQNLRAMAL